MQPSRDHLRPSREELYKLFVVDQVFRFHLAARYGVSEHTIKRWCNQYGISVSLRGRRKKLDITKNGMRARARSAIKQ